jgi:hypothetical protein
VERAFVASSLRSVGEKSGAGLPIGKQWGWGQLSADSLKTSSSANFARVGGAKVCSWANNGTLFADVVNGKRPGIGLYAQSSSVGSARREHQRESSPEAGIRQSRWFTKLKWAALFAST